MLTYAPLTIHAIDAEANSLTEKMIAQTTDNHKLLYLVQVSVCSLSTTPAPQWAGTWLYKPLKLSPFYRAPILIWFRRHGPI